MLGTPLVQSDSVDFLVLLDALVKSQPGPSGFEGVLAFGVAAQEGETWWVVRVARAVETAWVEAAPADADVVVRVGADDVRALLAGSSVPGRSLAQYSGNKDILDRFAQRFVRQNSLLDIRQRFA